MMRVDFRKFIFLLLILSAVFVQGSSQNHGFIPLSSGGSGINPDSFSPLSYRDPITFTGDIENIRFNSELSNLSVMNQFVQEVFDGNSNIIRGIYSKEKFALPIVQQPSGQAGFVSTIDEIATQFSLPKKYGVIGILAHNYLSGRYFINLQIGDVIQVIYGDGEIREYQISEIQSYQALQPQSQNSLFIDLDSGESLSSTQLFKRVYMGNSHLTLQTCIEMGTEESWGRLFVIADPL